MKKLIVLTVVLAAALGFLVPDARAVSLRSDTPSVKLVLKPGERHSATIGIQNPTEDTAIVKVYAEDWSYTGSGTGEKEFFVAGTIPESASNWVTVNASETILPPFGKRDIVYSVVVPPGEKTGTYRTVLFFETVVGESVEKEGASVLVTARLGTIFAIEIAGTVRRKGEIKSLEIRPPLGSKPAEFAVGFHNTGNSDIELKGNFMILDAQGAAKGRGNLESAFTHAGMSVSRTTTWAGRLDPGSYDLIFTFDLGEGAILSDERKMTVE